MCDIAQQYDLPLGARDGCAATNITFNIANIPFLLGLDSVCSKLIFLRKFSHPAFRQRPQRSKIYMCTAVQCSACYKCKESISVKRDMALAGNI